MKPAEALEAIRGYALANRIVLTPHAQERMRRRNVRTADVRHGLVSARRAVFQPKKPDWQSDRWKLESTDLDGVELELVVSIEDGVIVVTVY